MALAKIPQVTGTAVYVPGSDIDTDRIIPARFMKCVTFDGLGEFLFYDVRHDEPQALAKHGIKAVVAESFAEIFFGNATTLGMPCVSVSHDDVVALAQVIEAKPD